MTYEEYVERKAFEAAAATLSPLVTEFDRPSSDNVEIGNAWSRRMFDGSFYVSPAPTELPSTSLVFVQSLDRNTGAKDPSTLGGGDIDRHLIYEGLSRVAADAVLAGAETVRSGDVVLSIWRQELTELRRSLGLPRHPIQIVATLRGLTFDGLLFNTPGLRVVLLTVGACSDLMRTQLADRPWISVVAMPAANELPYGFRQLRHMGIRRISCIGGRTLARQLIDAGLIRDLYLTTSATPGGEPDTPLYPGPLDGDVVVRKRATGADMGVTFDQIRLGDGGG